MTSLQIYILIWGLVFLSFLFYILNYLGDADGVGKTKILENFGKVGNDAGPSKKRGALRVCTQEESTSGVESQSREKQDTIHSSPIWRDGRGPHGTHARLRIVPVPFEQPARHPTKSGAPGRDPGVTRQEGEHNGWKIIRDITKKPPSN
jgi:hypothetical protein